MKVNKLVLIFCFSAICWIVGAAELRLISFGLIPCPLAYLVLSFGVDPPSTFGGVVHLNLRR
jgi:hypothetical protein